VIVNIKDVLTPATGFDGETGATAKHLPDEGQVDVCPDAGAASIAAPSMLAAITKKEIRATMKPAFGMATPSPAATKGTSAQQDPALPEDPLCIRSRPQGCTDGYA